MGNVKTPIIRPLRTKGGTFYTFASAMEDIGLNIAEKKNKIRLSHYAVLDIPNTNENYKPSVEDENDNNIKNCFNFYSCPDALGKRLGINGEGNMESHLLTQSANDAIAQSFMSYALNMESAIINDINYDYSTSLTVSERVFWKWLKESGAIRWYKDNNGNIREGDKNHNNNYINVVKSFGKIDGVSQRSSDYGMYNEVYVNIPSSFGTSTPILFKQVSDNNYGFKRRYISNNINLIGYDDNSIINTVKDSSICKYGFYDYSDITESAKIYYSLDNQNNKIWSDEYAKNILDNNVNMYLTDSEVNDKENNLIEIITSDSDDGLYPNYKILRSKYDCMMLDILLNNEEYLNEDYDSLSTKIESEDYQFNTILLYYSVYDINDNILATNLYGVYFIDSPVPSYSNNTSYEFEIPRLNKLKSTNDGFGTSYSFRLNMRTSSIYDNSDLSIYDNSSSENSIINDFNDVVSNLNESIKLLGKHTKHTYILTEKYNTMYDEILNITNKLAEINNNVNNLLQQRDTDLILNSIETDNLNINNKDLNIVNNDNKFNINVNSSDIVNCDLKTNEFNIEPSLIINDIFKKINISNNSDDDANTDKMISDNNIFDYIKIVPKSSNNNNIYDLLDIEIRNDVNLDNTNFGIKNQKIDIITILGYILHKIKNI